MSYNLILLNDHQKQYSKRFSVFIDIKNDSFGGDIINFNFTSNLHFPERFLKDLDDKTKIIKDLLCTPKSAENIYTHTLEVLAEYLNPLDIGIVMDSSVEDTIQKVDERVMAMNSYSEAFRNIPIYERPSFEEWSSWEGNMTF